MCSHLTAAPIPHQFVRVYFKNALVYCQWNYLHTKKKYDHRCCKIMHNYYHSSQFLLHKM